MTKLWVQSLFSHPAMISVIKMENVECDLSAIPELFAINKSIMFKFTVMIHKGHAYYFFHYCKECLK